MDSALETLLLPGIIPMVGYALGLYAITSSVKTLLNRSDRGRKFVHYYISIFPVALGMISAPAVLPYILEATGAGGPSGLDVPASVSVFAGASAGALSKAIWDLVHKVVMRRVRGEGPDHG